jgi:hypothetical protein
MYMPARAIIRAAAATYLLIPLLLPDLVFIRLVPF